MQAAGGGGSPNSDLVELVKAWPNLSPEVRAALRAVAASTQKPSEKRQEE